MGGAACDAASQQTQLAQITTFGSDGFAAIWGEAFTFTVSRADLAILTTQVFRVKLKQGEQRKPVESPSTAHDGTNISSEKLLATSAHSVRVLREGTRVLPLWDQKFSDVPHCGLVVELRIISMKACESVKRRA